MPKRGDRPIKIIKVYTESITISYLPFTKLFKVFRKSFSQTRQLPINEIFFTIHFANTLKYLLLGRLNGSYTYNIVSEVAAVMIP